jgi:excisionase family DNA binding protein
MREPPTREILSIADLQEIVPIGRTKLYSLLSEGSIPSYTVGRRRLVKRGDVNRWLEKHKYAPPNSKRRSVLTDGSG